MIMSMMGFTLNMFSLLALSLSIGIVVDDAIMVLENIARHSEMGKDRVRAAADGAREITFAALAATLAVIAVFLPVALVKGVIGRLLFEFGITLCAAVGLSLVEAVTLTPMRCSQFFNVERNNRLTRWTDATMKSWGEKYGNFLVFALGHRALVILILSGMFILSILLAKFIPGEFMPAQDQGMMLIKYETPIGSSLDYTCEVLEKAEKIIAERPETKTYFLAAGGFQGDTVNSGIMFIRLKDRKDRTLSQQQLQEILRKDLNAITDLKAYVIDLSKGGPDGGLNFPISYSLQGPSLQELKGITRDLLAQIEKEKLAVDLNTDFKEGQPEVRLLVDREKASQRGVTVLSITDTVTAAVGGVKAGKYTNEDRRYDVRLRLEPGQRLQPEDIQRLQVRNVYGELIEIGDIVKFEKINTVQTIVRVNRERAISIQGSPAPGLPENEVLKRVEEIASKMLPKGYRLIPSDTAEKNKEFGMGMMMAIVLGILIAYMVLASQFNSYGHPAIILLSMPFALSGALLGLLLFGKTLNLFSVIGIMLLMGIVKKNSILLVEFTNQVRELEGLSVRDALIKACPIRLRPIIMTSTATIAAAVPPALAIGPGAESRVPMAITIICGTILSTLATLFIVPCVYSLFEQLKARLHFKGRPETATFIPSSGE